MRYYPDVQKAEGILYVTLQNGDKVVERMYVQAEQRLGVLVLLTFGHTLLNQYVVLCVAISL